VLVGDYTVTLAAADLPATMPDSVKQRTIGTWTLSLHQGVHYVGSQNGREVVDGPYSVSGNQFTLPAGDRGPYACRTTGTYTWQMNNDQLTFTRVQDQCEGRARVLTTRPLTRKG
jgi:hypothetical protein